MPKILCKITLEKSAKNTLQNDTRKDFGQKYSARDQDSANHCPSDSDKQDPGLFFANYLSLSCPFFCEQGCIRDFLGMLRIKNSVTEIVAIPLKGIDNLGIKTADSVRPTL